MILLKFTNKPFGYSLLNFQRKGSPMNRLIQRFVADELGATAIEYGLIVALIAVTLIGLSLIHI